MASKKAKAKERFYSHQAKESKKSSKSKSSSDLGKKQSSKSSGVSDSSSQYNALMKKYEKTLSPSDTETQATKQLSDLTQSAALGVAKQGQETMPMNVITGSQANIQEQASLKSAPLTQLIAAEQAKRSAAGDVLQSQSGLLEKKMAAEQAAATEAAKEKAAAATAAQAQRDKLAQIAASKSGKKSSGSKNKDTVTYYDDQGNKHTKVVYN